MGSDNGLNYKSDETSISAVEAESDWDSEPSSPGYRPAQQSAEAAAYAASLMQPVSNNRSSVSGDAFEGFPYYDDNDNVLLRDTDDDIPQDTPAPMRTPAGNMYFNQSTGMWDSETGVYNAETGNRVSYNTDGMYMSGNRVHYMTPQAEAAANSAAASAAPSVSLPVRMTPRERQ